MIERTIAAGFVRYLDGAIVRGVVYHIGVDESSHLDDRNR
jgi:hypothetical protein